MNRQRITVLVENTAQGRGLLAEHGLAFWIEAGPQRILFDSGQSDIVERNAEVLGIDLRLADAVILSHGHYDHTGGLGAVLRRRGRRKVYAHPEALRAKFARNPDGTSRPIGMPDACSKLLHAAADIVWTESPVEVCNGLYLTGPVPRLTDYEDVGGPFFKDAECTRPDDLVDDQAAFFDTSDGTVVVLGCAHAGIVNTLNYVSSLNRGRPIHTVIGGTHLVGAGKTRMRRTIEALRGFGLERMFPIHCTGATAAARLREAFPGRVSPCSAGTVLEF